VWASTVFGNYKKYHMINQRLVHEVVTSLMSSLPSDVEYGLVLLDGLKDEETLQEILRRCYKSQLIFQEAATTASNRLMKLRDKNQ
jgi:hypothetical protein